MDLAILLSCPDTILHDFKYVSFNVVFFVKLFRLKDWDLKFEQWKFELKDVVDECNKQRKRSSEIAIDVSSSAKQPKISNESLKKSFVNSGNLEPFEKSDDKSSPEKCSESVKKIAIDFKLLLSLDANTDMMEYIQGISQSYMESLDKKYVVLLSVLIIYFGSYSLDQRFL